ncbi:hypothetical protein FNH22_23930 [Fulvivirga sp. M361]|uniref:hypothetical protein n=1 Tax=Fulvivirga sp. M361 TaxID=2594266 RepID=UPI00117A0CD7|nr:hypothetical protein [Fulvivirga sp. M361]TRX51614.1 hypothetical protein FNH22_23930 [Fulvivirga sp. M361]
MEYTYRLSADSEPRRMVLKENALDFHLDDYKLTIPYAKVVGVWLSSPDGLLFSENYSCTLNIEDGKPIFITMKNFDGHGQLMTQDNHYSSFIRVLHLHLREKSKARYYFGVKPLNYFTKLLTFTGVIVSCLILYFFFNLNEIITIFLTVIAFFFLLVTLRFGIRRFPKIYDPDEIPLNLLPG